MTVMTVMQVTWTKSGEITRDAGSVVSYKFLWQKTTTLPEAVKMPGLPQISVAAPAQQQHQVMPRYLEAPNRLINELRSPDGSLKEEAD